MIRNQRDPATAVLVIWRSRALSRYHGGTAARAVEASAVLTLRKIRKSRPPVTANFIK